MAIEIRPATVVDRRGLWVLMAGGELYVPERHTGIEGATSSEASRIY
jgi:hypothetical protein